ncbi:MAG: hypothetical protein E7231_18875 [Cellulosilyticum sp.]|jgi:hypothetical protein|nr:hypothetical protein [Cellulosilyticum sp.]
MKKVKQLIAVLASICLIMFASITPLYAATYTTSAWVNSNYLVNYIYKYLYTAHIQHNNGTITSAGTLSFTGHNCSAPIATQYGCAIGTSQVGSFVHSGGMAATYTIGVDVSVVLGTGGLMYIGSTQDTVTAAVVTRSINNPDDIEYTFTYEPGKELHYDENAAIKFAEKYNISIESIEQYNGV